MYAALVILSSSVPRRYIRQLIKEKKMKING
jgi:hypothetical protein